MSVTGKKEVHIYTKDNVLGQKIALDLSFLDLFKAQCSCVP